jgi:hypothetical protein
MTHRLAKRVERLEGVKHRVLQDGVRDTFKRFEECYRKRGLVAAADCFRKAIDEGEGSFADELDRALVEGYAACVRKKWAGCDVLTESARLLAHPEGA